MTASRFLYLALATTAMVGSGVSSAAAFIDSTNPKIQADRELSLVDDWNLALTSATQIEGQGISLVYSHGGGGTPNYKIYGREGFGEEELFGETCRSKGGQQREAPLGMIIMTTPGDGEFSIDVDLDTGTLDGIFIHQGGDTTVIQYCVYVSLVNTATNEDATYIETEIRFKLQADSSVTVDSFEPTLAQPDTMDYTVTVNGLRAEICKVPASPGDIVSVCINSTDPLLQSIVTLDSFVFESDGGISQVAFDGGAADSLTEVAFNDGTSFQFNTMLKADFFRKPGTKVTGQGTCTLKAGSRKLQDLGMKQNETENVALKLAFLIGSNNPSSSTDRSESRGALAPVQPPPNSTESLSSSTQSSMYIASLTMSMLVLVSIMAIGLMLYRDKVNRGEIRRGNDSAPKIPLETDDDPLFGELQWV